VTDLIDTTEMYLRTIFELEEEGIVALHPRDGLAHRGAALVQPLRDPCAERNDAFFLELENGSQVHLGRVDQVVHAGGPLLGPRDLTRYRLRSRRRRSRLQTSRQAQFSTG